MIAEKAEFLKRNDQHHRVLIAGFGSAGRRHFRNLRSLGCHDFVFFRSGHSTLDDAEIGNWPLETDLFKALSHQPTIVIVANPTSLHVPVALEAARAGCDLFIEKPLSSSLDNVEELIELVDERNLVTMIGCQFRFHPLLLRLRSDLAEGLLGTVLGARAEYGEFLPDWHPWEDYRNSYSARADLGGGVLLTLIHPLDYLHWLFGPVSHVNASIRQAPQLNTPIGEDWGDMSLEFADGVMGQVHVDYVQRPPVHQLKVWGDQGRATLDFLAGRLNYEFINNRSNVERVPSGFDRNTMFVDEMSHFLDCVAQRCSSRIPISEGLSVLELALEARSVAQKEFSNV